ncbi:MAG: alpha/beta hydrolase [Pseudomonadota bacterium]|nr:alpha/beta hydrolase [Pseudomonadota bacterium]
MTATPETVQIATPAGHDITARIFKAESERRGVCIIAPATGVAQYLYDDFAHWLADQGFEVVTFDYDGIGLSLNGHVKHSRSDKLSWANNDSVALLGYVKERFSGLSLTWIGHSVGTHVLGMMPSAEGVDRVISVGAGTGTWWMNAAPTKRVAWFLWYGLVPATVPFLGYFPGDRLKVMCNLPKGVIMQWRRWCLHGDYCVGAEGDWLRQRFAKMTSPMTCIAFTDDDMMSMANVDALHGFFTGSAINKIVVSPEDVGQKRIGHIGWHKKKYLTLWDKVFAPVLNG